MKIALIGATGGTGIEFMKIALEAGHELTCIARTPSKITTEHERLTVARGDVYDAASMVEPLRGQDALVGAFGVPAGPRNMVKPTTIYSEGIVNVMAAMREAGLSRLVMLSSSGTLHDPKAAWFWNRILRPLSWKMYTDMLHMDLLISETDLDWTIVRPPQLVDGPATGDLKVAVGSFPEGTHQITRADLARFLLDEVEEPSYMRQRPIIAGP